MTGTGRPPAAPRSVEVIALIASAGGLEAITGVLRLLPADLPAAVVVAQHLAGQSSKLVEILQRRVGLPVAWARPGQPLAPGVVAVCPPQSRMEVLPDRTLAVAPDGNVRDRPLDGLLGSLAESFGEAALGVVLTGMGQDGARGARALREAGGLVVAQSEETAEHPAMPRAAVEAGAVDLVLPLYEIGPALMQVVRGGPLPRPRSELDAVCETFGGQGEMAELARATDWSASPLGPVAGWPALLRSTIRLSVDLPDPAVVLWGEDLLLFPNDAVAPMSGGRHRAGLGRPAREVVPEAWDTFGPLLARALAGESVRMAAVHTPFERGGRLEDLWFELSLTPVRAPGGEVCGVLQILFERTDEVLAARRLTALNALARAPRGADRADALRHALDVLAACEDVPFAAAYLLDRAAGRAELAGAAGVQEGGPMAPRTVALRPGGVWPVHEVAEGREPVVLDDLAARFAGRRAGAGRPEAGTAVLHPIADPVEGRVVGGLVLGVHPRLALNDNYREFLMLVADTVDGRVGESRALERERDRIERLAELDRAKSGFFSNISHEFRTPLTLVLGQLDAALEQDGEMSPGSAAELDVARRNARRLLLLTDALLDFSQADAGRLRPRLAPTDLGARTAEVLAHFHDAAERAGLTLTVSIERLDEPVWADAEMWERIVSNLMSNALKFTFDGEIEVTLRRRPKHVELAVRDTGVGIPEEELPSVFQRFHQVQGGRSRTHEGAGIGLALVDELVRRHGGRVHATSTIGSGSTFTVWLPLGRRSGAGAEPHGAGLPLAATAAAMAREAERWIDGGSADAEEDPGRRVTAFPAHAGGAHVLIVEGNADMREYLERVLAGHWRVTLARDGAQALERIRADAPDLVLADVMTPRLGGRGLLDQLRADPATAAMPVVLLTARAGEDAAIEGLLHGADDYVVKPFSARELVARVGGQLDLAGRRRAADRRLRAFVHAGWDVVYRMSPDWSEIWALEGPAFLADAERLDASWLETSVDPLDRSAVLGAIEEAIRSKSALALEHRVRRADGSLGWTSSRAVPLLDDDGEIEEWIGAARDVTAEHGGAPLSGAPAGGRGRGAGAASGRR